MAIKYIPYFPNTLEGQAVLDNFVRTKRVLRYRSYIPGLIIVFIGHSHRAASQSHLITVRRIIYKIRHQISNTHIQVERIKINEQRCVGITFLLFLTTSRHNSEK